MIPKCICEGDFDGEQTHRSNPMAVCPVHDDCEWCEKAKAGVLIGGTEKVCAECDYTDQIERLQRELAEVKDLLQHECDKYDQLEKEHNHLLAKRTRLDRIAKLEAIGNSKEHA